MSDQPVEPTHDDMFQQGISLINEALSIFVDLNSVHGKVVAGTLTAVLTFAEGIYNTFKK